MTSLICRTPRSDAPSRLVCFPHAGGSAQFFAGWENELTGAEVHAVQYPGRAQRIAEPLPTDLRRMAADLADAVRPLLDRPVVFFGHSMGAVVAYETALLLQDSGTPPHRLIASGSRAPHRERPSLPEGEAFTEEAVVAAVMQLGGTDAQLLSDPLLRELVLPYLCADLEMFDAYRYRPEPILHCPVTAITGDMDDHVTAAEADAWAKATGGRFDRHVFSGGHFYLTDDPPFALLADTLKTAAQGMAAHHISRTT
ncbi:thioesterase II family protein [Streptomyces paradoxus]|uniref:thioesterase II family protein n=1 Tax=Streptomyces paradoxus TaxID=66375 RepID=UPI0036FE4645